MSKNLKPAKRLTLGATALVIFYVFTTHVANAQLYTPGGIISGLSGSTTNVGIGYISGTTPAHLLHIMGGSEDGNLFRTSLSGTATDFLEIKNALGSSSQYVPLFWGHNEQGNAGLIIEGSCNVGQDIPANGGLINFTVDAYTTSAGVTTDPGTYNTVNQRHLFDWINSSNLVMTMVPNSGGATLGIGNSSPDTRFSLDLGGGLVLGTPGCNRLIFVTRAWVGSDFIGLEPTAASTAGLYFVTGQGIGIGSSDVAAGATLTVSGSLYAEAIKIELPVSGIWPDYVFENDYKLMPLKNLETFVKENKHLPNVPVSDSVEENGIDVGAMQTLEMQKIEELSLYIIQLHNENEALKAKLDKIEESINKN